MNEKQCDSCRQLLNIGLFYPIKAKGKSIRYEKICKTCKKSRRNRGNECIEPYSSCPNLSPILNRKDEKKLDYSLWEALKGANLNDDEKCSININLKTLIKILADEKFRQTGESLEFKANKYNLRS